jgi:Xaa-Pro aminopeptidase
VSAEHQQRLGRLRARLAEADLDGLVVSTPSNIFYLSGFTGSSGALLVSRDRAALLSDFRYRLQAREQATDCEFVEIPRKLYFNLGALAKTWELRRVGFEGGHLTCEAKEQLAQGAEGVELTPASPVEELRVVKSAAEVACIRAAAHLADDALAAMVRLLRPGVTEREVALEGEFHMRRAGAEAAAFDLIVAFGPHSALPHAETTERRLQPGDLVVIDIGARVAGYCSDMTRTFASVEASPQAAEIYSICYRAQRAAAAAVKPGAACGEVDAVARTMIEAAGYGDAFGHGLGHGVGIDVHEGPRLAREIETKLQAGSVVTVEPGIYLADIGGVRLEDLVLVGEDGAETLTGSPMAEELPII